jgi:hypothetical protein
LDDRRILSSFAKIAIASLAMGAAALLLERTLLVRIAGDSLLTQAFRLGATIVFALLVLGGAAHVLRIREFREAIALALKRSGSEA